LFFIFNFKFIFLKILSRQSKQKTVAQIKEQLCHSCVTNIEDASVERVQSDLDLRQKVFLGKNFFIF